MDITDTLVKFYEVGMIFDYMMIHYFTANCFRLKENVGNHSGVGCPQGINLR